MAWETGIRHTGHCASEPSQSLVAHSMQKKLWPHGTRACVTLASLHSEHLMDPRSESTGLTLFVGEGRDGVTCGYAQMLESAVAVSKLGESPSPSSRSLELHMAPRSPRPPEEVEELLELQDPELEKDEPEELENPLLVDEVIVGKVSGSAKEKIELRPLLSTVEIRWSESSMLDNIEGLQPIAPDPGIEPDTVPVRIAMCASISLRAVSTLSGSPVTSNTGSLSRLGVTM